MMDDNYMKNAYGGAESSIEPIPACAKRLIKKLKNKVDAIVPMTHQGMADDLKLLEDNKEFPLIIGGHDHDVMLPKISDGRYVIKAGMDAKFYVVIDMYWSGNGAPQMSPPRLEQVWDGEEKLNADAQALFSGRTESLAADPVMAAFVKEASKPAAALESKLLFTFRGKPYPPVVSDPKALAENAPAPTSKQGKALKEQFVNKSFAGDTPWWHGMGSN